MFYVGETQLGQQLLRVNREEGFDRFKFCDDFSINNDVRSKGLIKPKTFVHYRHRLLTVRSQASLFQLVSHYYFVNRFEKTWTKFRMNTKSGVQYLLRDFVFCHAFCAVVSFVDVV